MKIENIEIRDFHFSQNQKVEEKKTDSNPESERAKIKYLISIVAQAFLVTMDWEFSVKNTHTINTIAYDLDSWGHKINSKLKLGTREPFNHFANNIFLMSRSKFWSLNSDLEKLRYLADCHFDSLMKFCSHFGEDMEIVEEAYRQIRNWDWYIPIKNKEHINRDKSKKIWIQKMYGYDLDYYRLAVEDLLASKISYYPITEKDSFMKMWLKIDYSNLTAEKRRSFSLPPSKFTKQKWKGKNLFTFYWGSDERYEFDTKTEILKNG